VPNYGVRRLASEPVEYGERRRWWAVRRMALILTLALAGAIASSGVASGTHSNGTGPKKDLVAGTARLVGFNQPLIHVNAERDPSTDQAKGHFFIKYPPPFDTVIGGRVTCLNVAVNGAAAVGTVEKSQGTMPFTVPEGTQVQVRVLDNGEPGTLDMANWDLSSACSGVGDLPTSEGNYIVHPDPPLQVLSVLDSLLAEFEAAADCPYGRN
jgi:hypothetical protein